MAQVTGEWYVDFFVKDYYRIYAARGVFRSPERTEREVEFVAGVLGLPPGARILDLACGHGRHAIPLAQRGYDVTGVDLSALHLRLARKAAREAGARIRWVRSDMRDIPFVGEFDAVINMFTSFAYFESEEEDFKVLEAVAQALKAGGLFFIDIINREWLIRRFQETDWREHEDGLITMERRRLDLLASRNQAEFMAVEPSGRRTRHMISLRLYTLTELSKMLSRGGMAVRQTWGGFDGQEYGLDSPRMIVLAEKT